MGGAHVVLAVVENASGRCGELLTALVIRYDYASSLFLMVYMAFVRARAAGIYDIRRIARIGAPSA